VPVTKRNLKASEPKGNKCIDLKEFIPLASVDPVYFENTHFLGADQGGEKPYRLLADARRRAAVLPSLSSSAVAKSSSC
jgi:DNA end-binding protein Ku